MPSADITIGMLSSRTGVNIETVRYYEKIGLIPRASRSPAGRRVFGVDDIQRLGFIRRARQLGFSIEEIRSLLRVAAGIATCKDAQALAIEHRDAVRSNIRDLQRLEKILTEAAAQCGRGRSSKCAVVEALTPAQ